KYSEVTQQSRTDTLSLIVVDDGEGDLRCSGLVSNIAAAGNDRGAISVFDLRDQRHMIGEVDVQKESAFLVGETTFGAHESAIDGLGAAAADSNPGVFGTSTQANERHTRSAGCMKKYGYRI